MGMFARFLKRILGRDPSDEYTSSRPEQYLPFSRSNAGFDIRFYEVGDVRIYDVERIENRTVRDIVLVIGDGEGRFFERKTGRLCEFEYQNVYVAGLLFERDGDLCIILGIGRNSDGSGIVPGQSSVIGKSSDGHETMYKIVFALEGISVATIHRDNSAPRYHSSEIGTTIG
jgi:hypothetical protein